MSDRYVLQWIEGDSPLIRWYLRGIFDDGRFYGELMSRFDRPQDIHGERWAGIQTNVEGTLAEHDNAVFHSIVEEICKLREETAEGRFRGMLGRGEVSNPTICYRFHGEDDGTPAKARFLQLVDVVRPYVEPFYSTVLP